MGAYNLFKVQYKEQTAAKRTVAIDVFDTTDGHTPETGIAAAKAKLRKNFGTASDTTNNFAEVDATESMGEYKLVLAKAELSELGIFELIIRSAGKYGKTFVEVVDYDYYAAGALTDDQRRERASISR